VSDSFVNKSYVTKQTYLLFVGSAAMLCFYSYVLISGGNPPPKKKLASADPS